MTRYTIHTQNKNLKRIKEILNTLLINVGYNITEVSGCWRGKSERALKIEIISNSLVTTVKAIAEQIREENKQEVVLVTAEEIQFELI